MDEMGDWVSMAGALGALGVSPYHAEEQHVRFVIETVLASDRLHLGRVGGSGFRPLPGSTSVEVLAERLLPDTPDVLAVERVGAMMELFIDDRRGIAGR